jgi:hypothetical protein
VRLVVLRPVTGGLGFASLALLVMAASACGKDPMNPGEPLGTFHVSATLQATSCGATTAAPASTDDVAWAPPSWAFDIRLAQDGSTLYWIQGDVPVSGNIDPTHRATLSTSAIHVLVPPNTPGQAACAMERNDAVDLTLAGSPITHLSGALRYAYTPTSDSDCSAMLAAAGGSFQALPCQVVYAITADRTVAPATPK